MEPAASNKLTRAFFLRDDTPLVARELLGKLLVVPDRSSGRVSGMIVETEAYLGVEDRAAHSFGGRRTRRTEVMFAEGGHVYVFFIYGMYNQLNFVTGPADHPHAILIRAIEPVEGVETMRRRRKTKMDTNLTSGPGKLCIAMGIDRSFNAEHLFGDRIWVENYRDLPEEAISSGPRVGIDYAGSDVDRPWRFWASGNDYVSRVRRAA